MIYYFIGLAMGILISFIFVKAKKPTADGVLYINDADPEKDTYIFEIEDVFNLEQLKKKSYVYLRVAPVSVNAKYSREKVGS